MTLSDFFESIPIGDIDQDFRNAPYAAGLYLIVNTVTWKAYIGQSQRIASRFLSHRGALRRNKHSNRLLQDDWNKYGEAIFRFCVFERMHTSLLYESESQLIASSAGSCYNYLPDQNAPELTKINLLIDSRLHNWFKAACAAEGRTMSDVLAELIARWLERRKEPT